MSQTSEETSQSTSKKIKFPFGNLGNEQITLKKMKQTYPEVIDSKGLFPKNTLINILRTNSIGLSKNQISSNKYHSTQIFNLNQPKEQKNLFDSTNTFVKNLMNDSSFRNDINHNMEDNEDKEEFEINQKSKEKMIAAKFSRNYSSNFRIMESGTSGININSGLINSIKSIKSNKFHKDNKYLNHPVDKAQQFSSVHKNNYNSLLTIPVSSVGLQNLFSFSDFNLIQSNCLDLFLESDDNIIISAPTGSGKTVLFELAIAKILFNITSKSDNRNEINSFHKNYKIIYLAPIKTLCQQKYKEWNEKFSPFSLTILELTGDSDVHDIDQYESAHIIITTPEKWDSLTRRWRDKSSLVLDIALILIDEVHLLNTEERGATLEAVISRMKIISKSEELPKDCPARRLRIIAVSATIPNMVDIAEWLGISHNNMKHFGQEYRSIKLEKHVLGYNMAKNEFQFERNLNYRLVEIVRKYSSGKPTLIFCQTQKGTVSACEQIVKDLTTHELLKDELHLQGLIHVSQQVKDKNLMQFIAHGIGFHNASMTLEDRKLVEDLFIGGKIMIICTTSTLAMGVNLPARLVIIKSTLCYRGAGIGYTEYSPLEIEQMMGRAGRPQFDTQGVVVIMTEKSKVSVYQAHVMGKEELESHLFEQITEHINAEISLLTIKSVETLVQYLKSTFFYIRMKRNPIKYGLSCNVSAEEIDEHLRQLSLNIIHELHRYDMINYNSHDGKVSPLELGQDMSKYYVAFNTMKKLMDKVTINKENAETKEILNILSEASEYSKYRSKLEERKVLTELNTKIRYPMQGAISTFDKKANVLIQCGIGSINLEDWEMKKQQTEMMANSWRILICFKRYFQQKKMGLGLVNTIKLIKYIGMKTWGDNKITMLKQLYGVGDKMAWLLSNGGLDSFEKIRSANTKIIENICGKNEPWGKQLHKRINIIPAFEVIIKDILSTDFKVQINLKKVNGVDFQKNEFELNCNMFLIARDKMQRLLYFRYLNPKIDFEIRQEFSISLGKLGSYPVEIDFINDKYVGIDIAKKVSLDEKSNNLNEIQLDAKNGQIEKDISTKILPETNPNIYNLALKCFHSNIISKLIII